jgi:hypothetical protein
MNHPNAEQDEGELPPAPEPDEGMSYIKLLAAVAAILAITAFLYKCAGQAPLEQAPQSDIYSSPPRTR